MPEGQEARRGFNLFLAAAATTLAVLVVLLALQNFQLKRRLAELTEAHIPESELASSGLSPGDKLGAIVTLDEGGEAQPLEIRERTLLLVFREDCPACERTLPLWEDLVSELGARPAARVLGLRTDRGPGTSALHPAALHFPVLSVDRKRSPGLDQVPYVPTAILVGADGTVEGVWVGVPEDDQLRELRAALSGS